MTVREFAESEYQKHRVTVVLDDDQQNALRNAISEVARKFAAKFFNSQSAYLRTMIEHSGLSMQMKFLSDPAKEDLTKGIKFEAGRILQEFKEEGDMLKANDYPVVAKPPKCSQAPLMNTSPVNFSVAPVRHQIMPPQHNSSLSAGSRAAGTIALQRANVDGDARSHG